MINPPLPETIAVVPQPTGLLQPGYCRLLLAMADHSVPDDSLDICTRWSYCGDSNHRAQVRTTRKFWHAPRSPEDPEGTGGRMWGVCGGC